MNGVLMPFIASVHPGRVRCVENRASRRAPDTLRLAFPSPMS
jgi:hypothetical protein